MKSNRSCGACNGWLSWIRPPHYKFFESECMVHDSLYEIGGGAAERLKADKVLFQQMVRKSVGYYESRSVSSLWWFVTLSYSYYLAVRIFGKKRFNIINNKKINYDFK